MTNLLITEMIPFIIPTVTALAAWFGKDKILHALNVKEKKTSVEDARIRLLQSNLDYYQDFVEDLGTRYKDRLKDLEDELLKFKELTDSMKKIIEEQSLFIMEQEDKLRKYRFKCGELLD